MDQHKLAKRIARHLRKAKKIDAAEVRGSTDNGMTVIVDVIDETGAVFRVQVYRYA